MSEQHKTQGLAWTNRGDEWTGKRGGRTVAFVIKEAGEWNLYSPEEMNAGRPGRLEEANVGSREQGMTRAEALP